MPAWIPLCKCMQKYCESYFTAIERWRNCKDEELLKNRIILIETAFKILSDYSQNQETFEFDLLYDNLDAVLEPEVVPTAGKHYVYGGDKVAYEAAKRLVPELIFNRIGIFFQQNLLKAMAGWGESVLSSANEETRKYVILAIEKLLRLPANAGKGYFVIRPLNDEGKQRMFPSVSLSVNGRAFVELLIESKDLTLNSNNNAKNSSSTHSPDSKKRKSIDENTTSSSKKKKKARNTSKSSAARSIGEEDEEDPQWTTDHTSVGNKVAAFFPVPRTHPPEQRIFTGEVVSYAPPSKPKANDQLYHIVWEDGDEEDYEEYQYQNALKLYRKQFPHSESTNSSPQKKTKIVNENSDNHNDEAVSMDEGNSITLLNDPVQRSPNKEMNEHVSTIEESETISGRRSRSSRTSARVSVYNEEDEESVSPSVSPTTSRRNSQSRKSREQRSNTSKNNKKNNSRKGKRGTRSSSNDNNHDDDDDVMIIEDNDTNSMKELPWTEDHPVVGTLVAGVFSVNQQNKIYQGRVLRYCPPSAEGKKDHLYHIKWEDSDEEDYDDKQLERGKNLYGIHFAKNDKDTMDIDDNKNEEADDQNEIPWTTDHESIGQAVAGYFPPEGKRRKLFKGEVNKYAPPSAEGLQDHLYHVVWEDGDENDLEEEGFQEAIRLYEHQFILKQAAPKSKSKSVSTSSTGSEKKSKRSKSSTSEQNEEPTTIKEANEDDGISLDVHPHVPAAQQRDVNTHQYVQEVDVSTHQNGEEHESDYFPQSKTKDQVQVEDIPPCTTESNTAEVLTENQIKSFEPVENAGNPSIEIQIEEHENQTVSEVKELTDVIVDGEEAAQKNNGSENFTISESELSELLNDSNKK
jgi:hypothetical protein